MIVKVEEGQTLSDIAIQEYGTLEALTDLARANDISITDDLIAGTSLVLPDKIFNRSMQSYCNINSISPATEKDASGIRMRIFTKEFNNEFE